MNFANATVHDVLSCANTNSSSKFPFCLSSFGKMQRTNWIFFIYSKIKIIKLLTTIYSNLLRRRWYLLYLLVCLVNCQLQVSKMKLWSSICGMILVWNPILQRVIPIFESLSQEHLEYFSDFFQQNHPKTTKTKLDKICCVSRANKVHLNYRWIYNIVREMTN